MAYTKKFMDTLIELIFGLILLPVAGAIIATTISDPNITGSAYGTILVLIIGIILIFVALGLVYHVIKQLF
jgi:hypothetical protein